ncbi:MAG TPA: hypothetical protein VNQ73_02705 [Ilumatobacter sp.]|nr:hypothetical protein [Ilumatobacter sp.]
MNAPRPAGRARLDLSAFLPGRPGVVGEWCHAIRHLDAKSRVLVPELAEFAAAGSVRARMTATGWELRPPGRGESGSVAADARGRLHVPRGVCHQLGMNGAVVISAAAGEDRIVVWSATALDDLLAGAR